MNKQKLEIVIEQLERVHRDMNDCANRFILKDAIDQLQKQVKLFAIPGVVGQSEQLFCHHEGKYTLKSDGNCCKCHLPPNPKAE